MKGLTGLNNTPRGSREHQWTVNPHFVLFCFFQLNSSKLKASCDVKATKGSKRNLNLLQIPTFDFDKNINLSSYFFTLMSAMKLHVPISK